MPGRSALDDRTGGPRHRPDRPHRRAHRRRDALHGGGDGTVTIDTTGGVTAEQVASVAAQSGVLLVELRAADRTGLEQLFFALTGPAATDAELEEVSR